MFSSLISELIGDEDSRNVVYKDSLGIETIGVGRNLRDVGLSDEEIIFLLNNDISACAKDLFGAFPWVKELSVNRVEVLLNMCFNLGITRLKKFKKMWAALKVREYEKASMEMLDSKWARQVGIRATRLAKKMNSGR